ncbi:MAG: hypothetical protein OXJ37_12145 [Bryobacterales bacterium]|nr:hypothetical protein [Bryobacterales bacterium]MDE0620526.1 hypothetical protein [Bryobacterales bacterium]
MSKDEVKVFGRAYAEPLAYVRGTVTAIVVVAATYAQGNPIGGMRGRTRPGRRPAWNAARFATGKTRLARWP